jgi:hypothetical protein
MRLRLDPDDNDEQAEVAPGHVAHPRRLFAVMHRRFDRPGGGLGDPGQLKASGYG